MPGNKGLLTKRGCEELILSSSHPDILPGGRQAHNAPCSLSRTVYFGKPAGGGFPIAGVHILSRAVHYFHNLIK